MSNKKRTALILILLGSILSIFLILSSIQPNFDNFTLETPSKVQYDIGEPKFLNSYGPGLYRLKGTFSPNLISGKTLRIIPDDELKQLIINKRNVSLASIPRHQLKDYNRGFSIDLSEYLTETKNTVELIYYDRGGLMGIVLSSEPSPWIQVLISMLLFCALLCLYLLLTSRYKVPPLFQIFFILGMILRVYYFSITPADVRDHDLGDHIGYVEYLSTNWLPPSIEHAVGGAYFHPPLYYYSGATVYAISKAFEPHNKVFLYRAQQVLVLIYSLGFLFFGLLILQELCRRYGEVLQTENNSRLRGSGLFAIAGLLFSIWPVSIIHSVRIGNDPLLYFLFAASLYYIVMWYRSDSTRHLLVASIIGALAIITKANGEILIAVIGIIGLYKMLRSRQWAKYFKLSIIPCLIMFSATAITVAPGLLLKLEGKRDKLYIDNIDGLSKANLVGNTASNYLWFDAKIFITQPYTDPYDDRMGRQFFWNYLGKTALFGEFKYKSLLAKNTAVTCSFLFVCMLLYILGGIYHSRKIDYKLGAATLLSAFFLWAGVTYMRMTFPANIDFRYIVPILISFCGLFIMSIVAYDRIGATRLVNIGRLLAVSFSISSVLFVFGI